MNHGSLFSGIGGFDLAAEWMGWNNVFHCEINPFGQKIIKHYWPNAISYSDITKTDFSIHRGGIDILTGGFPCQPFSLAGKRKGTEDSRHLWPEMLRAIHEIQPAWIVGENVFGIISWDAGLVFEQVQVDLETEGYEVQPYVLPAAGVNAPHERYRVWFVAYSINSGSGNGMRDNGEWKESDKGRDGQPQPEFGQIGEGRITTNTRLQRQAKRQERTMGADELCKKWITPDTSITRREEWKQNRRFEDSEKDRTRVDNRPQRLSNERIVTDTSNKRLEGGNISGNIRQEKQERVNKLFTRQYQRTDWQNFPTVSPVHERNDGISDRLSGITFPKWRNEGIKAMGNAIVPQVALQIFKAIEQYKWTQEKETYREEKR